jgi:gluconate 2-dehydrogenase gamma chain
MKNAELVQIGGVSRRGVLHRLAAAMGVGLAPREAVSAQHVHQAAKEKDRADTYRPKLFNAHEYATLRRLAELIVPADERSGSALDAGAPEFIDLLCSQNSRLASIYTGGLLWLDHEIERRHGRHFVDVSEDEQLRMLDLLSGAQPVGEASPAALAPGREFFQWIARMTVDAFYTSAVGIKDIGYVGNKGMTKYEVPEEAIQYALRRSPLSKAQI